MVTAPSPLLAAALRPAGAMQVLAYLDPGAGSYVFQMLLASLLAALYVIKVQWRRLWSRHSESTANRSHDDDEA